MMTDAAALASLVCVQRVSCIAHRLAAKPYMCRVVKGDGSKCESCRAPGPDAPVRPKIGGLRVAYVWQRRHCWVRLGSMGSQKGGASALSGPRQQVSEEPSLGKRSASRDGNDSNSRATVSLNPSGSGEFSNTVTLLCDQ